MLEQVVGADPKNEIAWLWLSGLMETDQQKRDCLERVLLANPQNVYARAGLERLERTPPCPTNQFATRIDADTSSNVLAPSNGGKSQAAEPVQLPARTRRDLRRTRVSGLDELSCPACDQPIKRDDKQCSHCFLPFRSLDELLARPPSSRQAPQRKRRGFLGYLFHVLKS